MPKVIDINDVFRATTDVFAEKGYEGLTIHEVAHRSYINEVTIYRRFGTKAALLQAALAHGLSEVPFADLATSDDVEADLLAMAEAFQATTQMLGGAVITLLTESSRHPELQAGIAPLLVNLSGAVNVLEMHQRRGALVEGDPWQQLVLLLGPFVAGGVWARSQVTPPVELEPASVVAAFLHGHDNRRS